MKIDSTKRYKSKKKGIFGNCNIYWFLIPRYFFRFFSPFPLVFPLGLTVPALALLLPQEPVLDFRHLLPLPVSELPQPVTARPGDAGEVPGALPHVFSGIIRLRIAAPQLSTFCYRELKREDTNVLTWL